MDRPFVYGMAVEGRNTEESDGVFPVGGVCRLGFRRMFCAHGG